MREDAVVLTFRRIGSFFNKTARRGFSFPAIICKYTSLSEKRNQSALRREPSFSRLAIASSSKQIPLLTFP